MDKNQQRKVEVNINYLTLDQRTGAPIVVMKEKEGASKRILLIWIGESEAGAIQMQLENLTLPRPMTHDLLKTMIEKLEGEVTGVCVHRAETQTFYAQVYLRTNGDVLDIDARPSDAIALALRCDAPIYVAEKVIEDYGFPENELERARKRDPKDVLQNLDDDQLKQYTV